MDASVYPSLTVSAVLLAALLAIGALPPRYRRWAGGMWAGLLVGQIAIGIVGQLSWPVARVLIVAAAALAVYGFVSGRRFERIWLMRTASADAIVLASPFSGRWRVAAGGASPRHNHHTIARDQIFAYDFVRIGDESFGSPILAPVGGDVVVAEDGMPDRPSSRRPDHPSVRGRELGNHVAIATERGCVFLCHLKCGSIRVRAGDRVAIGDPVGECGNSGRTTVPHLHLHAQDVPYYAFDRANGLPVRFGGDQGRSKSLRFGEVLDGGVRSPNVAGKG